MSWLKETIGTEKAIIAMCHLDALPGDPSYGGDMERVIDHAREDLLALQEGGVDAVMFSNEFSLPYLTDVRPVTVASMGRIIGELKKEIQVPFGVNVLWDAMRLAKVADIACAMTDEALHGITAAYDPKIQELRGHQGQKDVAANLLDLLETMSK